ncbi:MAG: hypothetical protein INR69_04200 [Mucilaginibacter polytrichastri]|nr:hypothetical protein [Mucilaginibacter polytrichastri]
MKPNPNPRDLELKPAAHHETRLCQIWPQTREGLDILTAIITNPIAKIILCTVRSAGDAIVRKASN